MQKNYENEIFKRMFLNEDQLLALSTLSKLNISPGHKPISQKQPNTLNITDEDYNIESIYSDILLEQEDKESKIINYFTKKLIEEKQENNEVSSKSGVLDKNDMYIYSKLDLKIKRVIIEKVKVVEKMRLEDEEKDRTIN